MADRGSTSPNRSQNLERGVFSSISSINLYKNVIEERKQLHSNSVMNIKATKSKTPIRPRLIPSPRLVDRSKSPEVKPSSKADEEVSKLQENIKKLQQQLLREKKTNEKLEEQVKELTTKCKTDSQIAEKNIERLNKTCITLKSTIASLTNERDSLSKVSLSFTGLQEEFRYTILAIIKEISYFVDEVHKDFQSKIQKLLKNSMNKFKLDLNDALVETEHWRVPRGSKNQGNDSTEYLESERENDSLASTKGFKNAFADDVQNAVALYDFDKERDEDLEFNRGDMIEILEKNDSGWWIGRIGDRIGTFPFNFVNII
jgi:chromosome segregation ATPase